MRKTTPPVTWMSVAEFARVIGIDKSAIYYRIKRAISRGDLHHSQIMKFGRKMYLSPKATDYIVESCPYPIMDTKPPGWIDTGEAGRRYNLKRSRVANWVAKGLIRGIKVKGGKGLYIYPEDIERMLKGRPNEGDGWIRLHVASKQHGIPVKTIYYWIKVGLLEHKIWMREHYVRKSGLEKLVRGLRNHLRIDDPPDGWVPLRKLAKELNLGPKTVRRIATKHDLGYAVFIKDGRKAAYVNPEVANYTPQRQPQGWVKLNSIIGLAQRTNYAVVRLRKAGGIPHKKFLDPKTGSMAWHIRRVDIKRARASFPKRWFKQLDRTA